jgi:hypothetical protein
LTDGPDITAEWLTSALRASIPDVAVRTVELEKIGTGQTGASYRLHLDADGLPPTLVAKTAAGDRAARERVGQGYRSEVGFYTVLRDRVRSARRAAGTPRSPTTTARSSSSSTT